MVATTKVDLSAAAREGRFRDDLFYRLRGLEVRLPPLRDRGDDLLLAGHFLARSGTRTGRAAPVLSPEAVACLRAHAWPSNVRELGHALESGATLAGVHPILPAHLPAEIHAATFGPDARLFTLHLGGRESVPFTRVIEQVEDDLIRWALGKVNGQQTRAAELLGLPRSTFQSKLRD